MHNLHIFETHDMVKILFDDVWLGPFHILDKIGDCYKVMKSNGEHLDTLIHPDIMLPFTTYMPNSINRTEPINDVHSLPPPPPLKTLFKPSTPAASSTNNSQMRSEYIRDKKRLERQDMSSAMKQSQKLKMAEYYQKRKRIRIEKAKKIEINKDALEALKNLHQSIIDQTEEEFPQVVPDKPSYYKSAYNYINVENIIQSKLCAVCSIKLPCVAKSDVEAITFSIKTDHSPLPLYLLKSNISQDHPKASNHKFKFKNTKLNNLMLDPAGIRLTKKKTKMTICTICTTFLKDKKIPPFALANNFYTGIHLTNKLPELNWLEKVVIRRIRFSSCIVKLSVSKLSSQKGFKGHLLAKFQNPDPIISLTTPQDPDLLAESIHVILVHTKTEAASQLLRKNKGIFSVSRSKILAWLIFLKEHHPAYSNIDISQEILNKYPENDIPNFISKATTSVLDESNIDLRSESGLFMNHAINEKGFTSFDQLQKSVIIDDDGSTINVHDIYENLNLLNKVPDDTIAMMTSKKLVNINKPELFAAAFPTLFPCGLGMPRSERPTPVSFEDEIQHRLCISNDCFKKHFLFQCLCYDTIQKSQVFKSIHLQVKNMSPETQNQIKNVTVDTLSKAIQHKTNSADADSLSALSSQLGIAGSYAPFSQISKRRNRSELRSTLFYFGAPTWYITISPSDVHHVLAYAFCMKDPSTFDMESHEISNHQFRCFQAANNPVALSEFFYTIVQNIFDWLFGAKFEDKIGLLGKMNTYYGMVESQNRGTLHIHLLIWISGSLSPNLMFEKMQSNKDFKNKVLKYVEDVLCTSITRETVCGRIDCPLFNVKYQYKHPPDPDHPDFNHIKNHWLFHACQSFQYHNHNPSCYKNKLIEGCRYRKPDPISDKTKWNENTGSILYKKHDGYITNFIPELMLLTNSNTDAQFITSTNTSLSIIYYITNYITKNSVTVDNMYILQRAALERQMSDPLKPQTNLTDIQNHIRALFIRFFSNLKKCVQIPANEISTRLLRLPMCYTPDNYTNMNVFPVLAALMNYFQKPSLNFQSLLDKNISIDVQNDLKIRYHSIYDYIHRHESLEFLCWYDFLSYLGKTNDVSRIDFPFLPSHPYPQGYGLFFRTAPFIPNLYGLITSIDDESNYINNVSKYHITMNLLFKPFRNILDLNDDSWLQNAPDYIQKRISNMALLSKSKEEAIRNVKNLQIQTSIPATSPLNRTSAFHQSLNQFDSYDDYLDNVHTPTDYNAQFLQSMVMSDIFPEYRGDDKSFLDVFDTLIPSYNLTDQRKTFTNEISFHTTWKNHFSNNVLPNIATFTNSSSNTINSHVDHNASTILASDLQFENNFIDIIIRKYSESHTLNVKQKLAFSLITKHLLNRDSEQLILYIGGQAGTGKTQIVKAIVSMMTDLNCINTLQRMAFTSTAANNLGGRTIHYLTGINQFTNISSTTPYDHTEVIMEPDNMRNLQSKDKLYSLWSNKRLQIIDEVSFASKNLMESLDSFLRTEIFREQNKSTKLPFGGIHTVLIGDFYQHLSPTIDFTHSFLFKKINHVIILTQQMRVPDDTHYAGLLLRARHRKLTDDDFEFLNSKIITESELRSKEWGDALFIIPKKAIGYHVNCLKASQYSLTNNQTHFVISALHKIKSNPLGRKVQDIHDEIIKKYTIPSKNSVTYRTIELSKGSKVTILKNITDLHNHGLSNGCYGTVYDIVIPQTMKKDSYTEFPSRNLIVFTEPPIVLFQPDPSFIDDVLKNVQYDGLPPGVIPIFPIKEYLTISGNVRIHRTQLPLTGYYAITDYKAQGSTLDPSIIDLEDITAPAGAYVMLSRLTSSKGLRILRPFDKRKLQQPFSPHLATVLSTLDDMDLAKNI